MELGNCSQHDRPFEAYCPQLRDLVCPSCVMFGRAQGMKVVEPDYALSMIKDRFNDCIKKGILRSEYTQSNLVQIRQAKLQLEKNRNKMLKECDEAFTAIVRVLKDRK